MHLLLVALSIRIEEDYRWITQVLWDRILLHLRLSQDLFLAKRKEHTVHINLVEGLNSESSAVKVLVKHLF